MNNHQMVLSSAVFAGLLLAPSLAFQTKSIKLFDGKSFDGWEGNRSFFRIEQSAIVGGTMKDSMSHNEFLCTTNQYGDFVLRLKVKLLGDPEKANAGVQLRS